MWSAFVELHGERVPGAAGPGPITSACMLAWQQLSGVRLSGWECDTIRAIDRAYLEQIARQMAPAAPAPPPRP